MAEFFICGLWSLLVYVVGYKIGRYVGRKGRDNG